MPLAVLWTEAEFITEHTNALLKTHVVLLHAAMSNVLGGGDALKLMLAELDDG